MTFRSFLAFRSFLRRLIGQARGSRTIGLVGAGIVLSIVVFTVLLRKHLLRGITFGAVRK